MAFIELDPPSIFPRGQYSAAAVQMLLRLGGEIPIDAGLKSLENAAGMRTSRLRSGGPASMSNTDRSRRLGEARREDASGAAGANHDIVVHSLYEGRKRVSGRCRRGFVYNRPLDRVSCPFFRTFLWNIISQK